MRYNADSGDGEIRVSNVVNKTNSWKHNLTTNKITNAPASCPAPTRRFVSWLRRPAPALFSSSVSNITNDGDIQTGSHTCLVRTSLAPHQSLTISVNILKCKDQSSLSWMNQYVGLGVVSGVLSVNGDGVTRRDLFSDLRWSELASNFIITRWCNYF